MRAVCLNFNSQPGQPHHPVIHVGRRRLMRALLLAPLLTVVLSPPSCRLIGAALGLGFAKLQFGCLPEGTPIDTVQGPVRIENLKSGDPVIGFGGKPVRINQIHQYRENPARSRYLTVHFDTGASISASPRHRIDGTPAHRLKVGDICGSATVTRIESRGGVARSFDLLTEDAGYRIAGIPVNSMIAEMSGQRPQ
ncbi:MAG: Hint domain-containing protein [Akkermansiaceae bacterium]|jgi:hypothetical protein|nr:Hint domain-containing protein [Akkermansiaceae bacterium]